MYGLWHKQIYEDPMIRHVKYLSFLCHRKMLYRTSSKHAKSKFRPLHSRARSWHLDWLSICSFSLTDSYIYRLCNNGPEHFSFFWETGTEALSVEGTGKTLQGQKGKVDSCSAQSFPKAYYSTSGSPEHQPFAELAAPPCLAPSLHDGHHHPQASVFPKSPSLGRRVGVCSRLPLGRNFCALSNKVLCLCSQSLVFRI